MFAFGEKVALNIKRWNFLDDIESSLSSLPLDRPKDAKINFQREKYLRKKYIKHKEM